MKLCLLGLALLVSVGMASAQTITRTVTADGRVVYSDHAVPGAVIAQRTLSSTQLGEANVLSTQGSDASLRACQPDLARYCASRGGAKEGMECLLDHQQDVTDSCYAAMKQRMQSPQEAPQETAAPATAPARGGMQACQADLKKLCQGVQPGGGRLVKCLLDQQPSLSDACYSTLAEMKNKPQGQGPGGPPSAPR